MARLMGPTMSSISTSESRKVDPFFFSGGGRGRGAWTNNGMRDSFAHDGSVSPVLGVLQIDQVSLFLLLFRNILRRKTRD